MGAPNPLLTSLLLRDSLQGRDRDGVFSATATGPVRYAVQGGEQGYWAEEGSTNLVTNPVAGTNTTGWDAVSDVTLARETSLPGPLPGYLAGITTGFRVTADNPVSATNPIASCPLTLTAAAHAHGWWVWVPSAFSATGLRISDANFASATNRAAIAVDLSKRDQWQWVPNGRMNPDAGDLNGHIQLQVTAGTMGAGEQVWFIAQCEAKAYSTSLAVGSIGPGYSWASTAHASASVRASTFLSASPVNRIQSSEGMVWARVRRDAVISNAYVFAVGNNGAGLDRWYIRSGGGTPTQLLSQFFVNGSEVASSVVASFTAGAWHDVTQEWEGLSHRTGIDGVLSSPSARSTPTGTITGNMVIGSNTNNANQFDGLLRDLLIYDAPLSDARRAIVLDALDNEATEDELWGLFAGNPYTFFQLRPY